MDLPATYVALTEGVLHTFSLSHEAGHFWAGVILYLAVLALPQARSVPALPFLAVLCAELFNESVQAAYYGSWRVADTLADIGWTLAVPAILFIAASRFPLRLRAARQITHSSAG